MIYLVLLILKVYRLGEFVKFFLNIVKERKRKYLKDLCDVLVVGIVGFFFRKLLISRIFLYFG